MLWRCWLGVRKGIRPVEKRVVGYWHGYLSGARCRLAYMAQLMPLLLTVSCFSKIQIGFTFLVPADPGSPGKGPLNGCVCVCEAAVMWLPVSCSNLFLQNCNTRWHACGPTWNYDLMALYKSVYYYYSVQKHWNNVIPGRGWLENTGRSSAIYNTWTTDVRYHRYHIFWAITVMVTMPTIITRYIVLQRATYGKYNMTITAAYMLPLTEMSQC